MTSWRDAARVPLIAAACALSATWAQAADPAFFRARVAPILERHCTVCHGPEKQKSGLRLDSHAALMKGGESGVVVEAGNAKASDLVRRIKLPDGDEDLMPSDGKPRLSADEVKVIELWIAGGASETKELGEFPGAPIAARAKPPVVPLAPDWRPRAAEIAALQAKLGLKLLPRSQVPTDGLIVRTASAPARCDDAVLKQLAPVAELIVEAELSRTKVTDAGLATVATWKNLRALDLSSTPVTSTGVAPLAKIARLEALNLSRTALDAKGVERLKEQPTLKKLWFYGTPASPDVAPYKQEYREYVASGRYDRELAAEAAKAGAWLAERAAKRATGEKIAVVFDLDETLFRNWPEIVEADFEYVPKIWDAWVKDAKAAPIEPVREVYRAAQKLGLEVILLTGRHERERADTEKNLRAIECADAAQAIFMPDNFKGTTEAFKTAERKKLTTAGRVIIANIGDQDSDLAGGFAEKTFKLPNPFYTTP